MVTFNLVILTLIYNYFTFVQTQYPCSMASTPKWSFPTTVANMDVKMVNTTFTTFLEGQVSQANAVEFTTDTVYDEGTDTIQFPLTIAMWVKPSQIPTQYQTLFEASNDSTLVDRFIVYQYNTKLGTEYYVGNHQAGGNLCRFEWQSVFLTDVWVHFVITFSPTNINAYKNNVILTALESDCYDVSTQPHTVVGFQPINNVQRLQHRIGLDTFDIKRFVGIIEDFQLFESVLSAANIECVYSGQHFACKFPCSQCYAGFTLCLACVGAAGSNNRVNPTPPVTGDCECADTFWENNVNNCQTCNVECTTCTSAAVCTGVCAQPSLSIPHCKCVPGEFKFIPVGGTDGVDDYCLPCTYNCKTCTTDSICDSCETANFRVAGTNTDCPCQPGYYNIQDEPICSQCNYQCVECENTPNQCTRCQGGGSRRTDDPANYPNCDCEDGYYDDLQENVNCAQCDNKCLTCVNQSFNCKACQGNFRNNDPPGCTCQDHYYDRGNIDCLICNYRCETCHWVVVTPAANSYQECLRCRGEHRQANPPDCDCEDGYFDAGVEDCQPCIYYCKTCVTSLTNCVTCHQEVTRLQTPNCGCLPFYRQIVNQIACEPCHETCQGCSGPLESECTACVTGSNRTVQGGYCLCGNGFYTDENDVCIPCRNSCETCERDLYCLTCPTNVIFLRQNDLANHCPCQDGYYDDGINKICQSCHPFCITCHGGGTQDFCSECVEGELYNISSYGNHIIGSCKLKCQDGTYDNDNICSPCHPSCQTCNGPEKTNCLSCHPDLLQELNRSTTLSPLNECLCDEGYFEYNVQACQKCDINCKTCFISSTNCSSCNGKNKKLPKCDCIVDYELNINNDCQLIQDVGSQIIQFCQILLILGFLIIN